MLSKVLAAAISILAPLAAPDAEAASSLFRTYLSVEGSDSNPCTVSAPCRLLPAALASTQSGGEVWILDSANYNTSAVSIDKSVSILSVPGALGSLVANGYDAVDIAGNLNMVVSFSNMVFREIDSEYNYSGINTENPNVTIIVSDSKFSYFFAGLYAGEWNQIDIEKSEFYTNEYGMQIVGPTAASTGQTEATVTISACFVRENQAGVYVQDAVVALNRNIISGNSANGVNAYGGSNVTLNDNAITSNYTGVYGQGAYVIYSTGNNSIVSNHVNVDGSITQIAQQ